ncbi:GlxA family transcriptional regulator [Chitinophaga sp.]|uniref:GlxA family transcriptional regulator n=1 Tax=Chitinophaga sp. TaxID=1869181 RepID=UPI0031D2FAC2
MKHIALLITHNSTLLDFAGPLEVFTKAIDKAGPVYQTHIVSLEETNQIRTSSGMHITCEHNYATFHQSIDTLIIAGLPKDLPTNIHPAAIAWIQQQAPQIRRICSVCSGAFILAEAGLLNGKKATTHWSLCERLAAAYPAISVDVAPIFVRDGNVYTSAGITTGMDLALALLEEDMGKRFALEIARQMVLFLKRPGNQAQYSTVLAAQAIDHAPVREAVDWIMENLQTEITVEELAEKVLMSPRNFARVFVKEMNITPVKFMEKMRVEAACRSLTEQHLTQEEIAVACGFKNGENMRRVFLKVFDVTPSEYRKRFQTAL